MKSDVIHGLHIRRAVTSRIVYYLMIQYGKHEACIGLADDPSCALRVNDAGGRSENREGS